MGEKYKESKENFENTGYKKPVIWYEKEYLPDGNIKRHLTTESRKYLSLRIKQSLAEKREFINEMTEKPDTAVARVWKKSAETQNASLSAVAGQLMRIERGMRTTLVENGKLVPTEINKATIEKNMEDMAQGLLGMVYTSKNLELLAREVGIKWQEEYAMDIEKEEEISDQINKKSKKRIKEWWEEKRSTVYRAIGLMGMAIVLISTGQAAESKIISDQHNHQNDPVPVLATSTTIVPLPSITTEFDFNPTATDSKPVLITSATEVPLPSVTPEAVKIPDFMIKTDVGYLDLNQPFTVKFGNGYMDFVAQSSVARNGEEISALNDRFEVYRGWMKNPELAGILESGFDQRFVVEIHSGIVKVIPGAMGEDDPNWISDYRNANNGADINVKQNIKLPGQALVEEYNSGIIIGSEISITDIHGNTVQMKIVDARTVKPAEFLSSNPAGEDAFIPLSPLGVQGWSEPGITFVTCTGYNSSTGKFDQRLLVTAVMENKPKLPGVSETVQSAYSTVYEANEYIHEIQPNMDKSVEMVNDYFETNPMGKGDTFSYLDTLNYFKDREWIGGTGSGLPFIRGAGACDIATLLKRMMFNYAEFNMHRPLVKMPGGNGAEVWSNGFIEVIFYDHPTYLNKPEDEVVVATNIAEGGSNVTDFQIRVLDNPLLADNYQMKIVLKSNPDGSYEGTAGDNLSTSGR